MKTSIKDFVKILKESFKMIPGYWHRLANEYITVQTVKRVINEKKEIQRCIYQLANV